MAEYSDIFRTRDTRNWFKCSLAVLIAKEGLIDFVKDEIDQFQQDVLHKIIQANHLQVGTTCVSCTTSNSLPCPTRTICQVQRGRCNFHTQPHKNCPNKICDAIRHEIETGHHFKRPSWKNTDARGWCSNSWEVAKCFMPPDGYTNIPKADNTDFNGIISVLINCKRFEENFSDDLKQATNVCTEAREVGRDVRHCVDLKMDDTTKIRNIDALIKLLDDPKYLRGDAKATDARGKLYKLKNDSLAITTANLKAVLNCDDTSDMMADEIQRTISQKLQKFKSQLDDIESERNRKKIKTECHYNSLNHDLPTSMHKPHAVSLTSDVFNKELDQRAKMDQVRLNKNIRIGEVRKISSVQVGFSLNQKVNRDICNIIKQIDILLKRFKTLPIYVRNGNLFVLLNIPNKLQSHMKKCKSETASIRTALMSHNTCVIWGTVECTSILPKSADTSLTFKELDDYILDPNIGYSVVVRTDLDQNSVHFDMAVTDKLHNMVSLTNCTSKVMIDRSTSTLNIGINTSPTSLTVFPLHRQEFENNSTISSETYGEQRAPRVANESGVYAQASSDTDEYQPSLGYPQRPYISHPSVSGHNSLISHPTDDQVEEAVSGSLHSISSQRLTDNMTLSPRPRPEVVNQHSDRNTHTITGYSTLTFQQQRVQNSASTNPQQREQNGESTSICEARPQQQQVRPPRYPDFIHMAERILSYDRWHRLQPSPTTLADAGFFYTNQDDLVRCYQCGIGLKDFSTSDDPLKEHVKHSGNCDFLVQLLGLDGLNTFKERLQRQDPQLNRQRQLEELRSARGLIPNQFRPRHPEYSTYECRLSSFTMWPPHIVQRPEQLASAGLYYTGIEDHVRCFACDGGLRKWDPEDDPWLEHCRWFPACPYARQTKGDEFIELVQASSEAPENEIQGAASNPNDIVHDMDNMTLYGTEYQRLIEEHKMTCVDDMGFSVELFNEAVKELRHQGNVRPTIEDVFIGIELVTERQRQLNELAQQQLPVIPETPEQLLDENKRLKKNLTCMKCTTNEVNALFLPCTHHRFCMTCSRDISICPLCNRRIKEKIRTFLS